LERIGIFPLSRAEHPVSGRKDAATGLFIECFAKAGEFRRIQPQSGRAGLSGTKGVFLWLLFLMVS
jgi:hypothetical protein